MASDNQNNKRLNRLLNQVVYPTCEKILEINLRENRVSFYQFLETNKHRIMHCFRVNTTCCSLHADCSFVISEKLTKKQWSFLYKDEKTNSCRKSGCICQVITTCTTFRKLNLNVICFLIIEFSMLDGLKMEALKKLNVFNQEIQVIRTRIVPDSDFQTKWNTMTDSLIALGVTRQQIDEINRTPTPTVLKDKDCSKVCCILLQVAIGILIIPGIILGIIFGVVFSL